LIFTTFLQAAGTSRKNEYVLNVFLHLLIGHDLLKKNNFYFDHLDLRCHNRVTCGKEEMQRDGSESPVFSPGQASSW